MKIWGDSNLLVGSVEVVKVKKEYLHGFFETNKLTHWSQEKRNMNFSSLFYLMIKN